MNYKSEDCYGIAMYINFKTYKLSIVSTCAQDHSFLSKFIDNH